MYVRRISHSFVPPQHNLRTVVVERCENNLSKCNLIIRRHFTEWKNRHDLKDKLDMWLERAEVYRKLLFSKSTPEKTLKMWARQFECVLAQRVRRGQQMLCLYSRWWEEKALKEFLKRLRISLSRNGKEFIIGALGKYCLTNILILIAMLCKYAASKTGNVFFSARTFSNQKNLREI